MQTASESTGKSRVMSKREKIELCANVWQMAYCESFRCTSPPDAPKAVSDAGLALSKFKAAVFGAVLLLSPAYALALDFTSCTSTVTMTCQPGNVTTAATVSLTPTGGGGPIDPPPVDPPPTTGTGFNTVPAACLNVASIGNWQKTTRTSWLPGLPASTVDATDYRNVFSPPNSGQQPWPSASGGSKPVVSIMATNYLALGFVMPQNITVYPLYFNVNSISQPVSISISECPGDFGQQGTHIVSTYCKSNRTGGQSSGVQTYTGVAPGTCRLLAGHTYWLNEIAADLPPANSTTPPTTTCTGASCTAQLQLTY